MLKINEIRRDFDNRCFTSFVSIVADPGSPGSRIRDKYFVDWLKGQAKNLFPSPLLLLLLDLGFRDPRSGIQDLGSGINMDKNQDPG
jgi:hypothetical protein